ncbi:MAG: ATPase [Bacteroidaceae bacterium]|nr:ATPase [Bacteroidaceae bacterium]
MIKKAYILLFLFLLQSSLFAQDKLTVRPVGRILLDGGFFESNQEGLNNGIGIPDFRIGAMATFGKFTAYIDVCYARDKVRMKDVTLEGKLDSKNTVTLGYFYQQFGLQGSFSSSRKITMLEPGIDGLFVGGRQIGIMWVHDCHAFWNALSMTIEEEAMSKTTAELGNPGYGILSRTVYRPIREPGRIFHVGFSWAYDTPKYHEDAELNHRSYILSAYFPTQLSSLKTTEAVITQADHRWRFTPELCAAYGRLGIESQYYYMYVARDNNLPAYQTSGGYVQLRGLLKGSHYEYNEANSWMGPAGKGVWECVLGYNNIDLNHDKSEIQGGKMQDVSLTLNHYFNKYITWRLRYSYTKVKSNEYDFSVNALQTRIQVLF